MSLTWSQTGLPPGLTLNAATGTITGTPTESGEYTVSVSVTDGVDTATATLTMNVETVGTWSATGLPPGMACSDSGIISGTPTASGTYSVDISIDRSGVTDSTTLPMTIVEITDPPTIVDPGAQALTAGVPFTLTMTATDGVLPLTWNTSAGSLPTGVTISSTGVVSGTPTTTETVTATIRVSDTLSRTDTQDVTFTVGAAALDATYVCGAIGAGGAATIWKYNETAGTFSVDGTGDGSSFFSGLGLAADGTLVASQQNNIGGINKFWRRVAGTWGQTGVTSGYQCYDSFVRFASGRLAFATQTSGSQFIISDDNGASWSNGFLFDAASYSEAPYFLHVNQNNNAVFAHLFNTGPIPVYFLTNSSELESGSAVGGFPSGPGYNNFGTKSHGFPTFGRMLQLSTGRLLCMGGGTAGKKVMWNDSQAEDYTAWQTGTTDPGLFTYATALGPSDRVALIMRSLTGVISVYEYSVALDTYTLKSTCAAAIAAYSAFVDATGILFVACDNGCFVSTDNTWTTMTNKLPGQVCIGFGRAS